MTEGQKKRRIGVGMKPRGEQRQRGPEGSSAGNEHNEASTTEGQPESILDPVLNQMKQAETSSLATQETVQNLDSEKAEKEASPLHSLNSEEEEVALNNALAESGDASIRGFVEKVADAIESARDQMTPERRAGCDARAAAILAGEPTAADLDAVAAEHEAKKQTASKSIAEIEEMIGRHGSDNVYIAPNGEITTTLGPQPNGTLKVAVTIEEGYASAVKEWAEADGLSLEEWLTNLVTANIETYAMPAKGR